MTALAPRSAALRPAGHLIRRIAAAGLAGGAVDFVYASVLGALDGRSFFRVWQGVAGGWLGRGAADGGAATAALGVVTHFGIATCMAAVYALAAIRLPILYRRWALCAPLYGLALYGVMYRIVLPLRWPQVFPRWDGVVSILDIASHIGVAFAIAFVLSRRSRTGPAEA